MVLGVDQLQVNVAKTVEFDKSFVDARLADAEVEALSMSSTTRMLNVRSLC